MGDLVGIIFLIGLAVLVVVSTAQILRDRKKKTRLTEDSAASLDDSLILPIDINNEDFSMHSQSVRTTMPATQTLVAIIAAEISEEGTIIEKLSESSIKDKDRRRDHRRPQSPLVPHR